MKLIHLSDLHIGKRIREYSMLEDQEYIFAEIINIIDHEKPDGVIIAGDVYDKAVPSAEAVKLYDDFLARLVKRGLQIYVISGNHDSAERIACFGRIVSGAGVHLSPVYNGKVEPLEFEDEYGKVYIYMLPFIRPQLVKHWLAEEEIVTYTHAVTAAVKHMNVDFTERNVLITHQFIADSETCESDELSMGGTDSVDVAAVADFDYVALGHLHRPQKCTYEKVRYCGTPLKYSFSEAKDIKSVTVVELREKGSTEIRTVPLVPKRDMVELRGSFQELMQRSFYEGSSWQEDYVRITLTDEDIIPDAGSCLRNIYHKLMLVQYDNARTRASRSPDAPQNVRQKSEMELFSELFELQNGMPMSEEQLAYMESIIAAVKEDCE